MSVEIAPSILSADFADMKRAFASILGHKKRSHQADAVHLDVMDGHFVPNLTFGSSLIAAWRPLTDRPFDAHLMVCEPASMIQSIAAAGADIITVHAEACPHLARDVQMVLDCGKKAGVAINPATPVESVQEVLDLIDRVILMSVNPGFGGQAFIPSTCDKIRRLRNVLGRRPIKIEVDGGITVKTAPLAVSAGADILVAGASVFNSGDCAGAIYALRNMQDNQAA